MMAEFEYNNIEVIVYVEERVTASFGRAFAELRLWAWLAGAFESPERRA